MEIKVPVIIDGVKTVEELARRVLDEYEYKGMTVRQWADRIANPKTRADNIRSMLDDELAELFANKVDCQYCSVRSAWCTESESCCRTNWLEWLKQEVEDGEEK